MNASKEPIPYLCAYCGTECSSTAVPLPDACAKSTCLRASYLKVHDPPYPWDVDLANPARWYINGFEDAAGYPFYKNGVRVPPWRKWDANGIIIGD